MVNIKKVFLFVFCLFLFASANAEEIGGFDVNNVLLKLSLHQGESTDKVITLTATEDNSFVVTLENLRGATLEDRQFSLVKGESKNVVVHFDARGLKPAVYIGSVKISDNKETNILPAIFEVETTETLFDVNLDIPPQYKEVPAGDKLIAQVKVFDLTSGGTSDGQGPTRVELDYNIYTLSGQIVSSQSEDAVVSRQTQLTKTFSFPEDVSAGDYVLVATVKTPTSLGVSSSLFSITPQQKKSFFGDVSLDTGLIYFLIGILVFFFIFILLFVYFVRDRDKLIIELRKYHEEEVEQLHKFLSEQQKILAKHGHVDSRDVKEEVNTKMKEIQIRNTKREHELRRLEEQGDLKEMQRKIAEWKKDGYNTKLLEYKLKGLSTEDMKQIMANWKHKYGEGYKNTR